MPADPGPIRQAKPERASDLGDTGSATLFRSPLPGRSPGGTLVVRQLQFLVDIGVLTAAFLLAYQLRFDFRIPGAAATALWTQIAGVVLLQFAALALAGVYSLVWRYIGLSDIKCFLVAAGSSALILFVLFLALPAPLHEWRVPRSVIIVDTILAFGGVLGLRLLRRFLHEKEDRKTRAGRSIWRERKKVLLVGAGRAGVLAAREILLRGDLDLDVRGFVDDDPEKRGSVILGVRVLGTSADLPTLVPRHGIDHVILTIANATAEGIRRVAETCKQVPVRMRIIPALGEILDGSLTVSRIRDVEIEDLLGREPVQLEEHAVRAYLAGQVVAVTGAGGSIGSELARQLLRFEPATILLIERSEGALFEIDRELEPARRSSRIVPIVADAGDEERIRSVFASYHPKVVFHAAAHKHVPMMESNAVEAVKNNVLATERIGRISAESGVDSFVLISTDKAVKPSSIMGATKRMAELVVQRLARQHPTRFLAVRFGNVIGSAGSVVPIFQQQIRRGGPVTVTDPEMVRYFMTIPEAAQLVLQAGALGRGGEIFVLDMGEPVRIVDLARSLFTLSGFRPGEDIEIVFTGRRPGEKLAEELQVEQEMLERTRHPKIFIGKIAPMPPTEIDRALGELSAACGGPASSDALVRAALGRILPEACLDP